MESAIARATSCTLSPTTMFMGGASGKNPEELLVNSSGSENDSKGNSDVFVSKSVSSNANPSLGGKKKKSSRRMEICTDAQSRDTEGFTLVSTPEVDASSVTASEGPSSLNVSRNGSLIDEDKDNKI